MSNPHHLLDGPYTLKGDLLTFFVTDAGVALKCWHARENKLDLTVTITESEGTRDITGTIHSIELLSPGVRPSWQVVIRVS